MLELTAGKVATMFDTPMGFRHGPKSIINDETLTVVYVSDDPYTRQYETTMAASPGFFTASHFPWEWRFPHRFLLYFLPLLNTPVSDKLPGR